MDGRRSDGHPLAITVLEVESILVGDASHSRNHSSWTAAITGGIRDNGEGPLDYSIGFTFSIKAMPKYGVGGDTVRPYTMLGLQN